MIQYIIRRTLVLIPTLIVTTIVIFFIVRLAPGDPLDLFLSPELRVSEEEKARIRHQLGLDGPLYVQYWRWATDFFAGNMGTSFNYRVPAWGLIKTRLWPTIELMGLSLVLALIVAIPAGVVSALRQYSWLDNAITSLAFFGISMPNFWLGLLMIFFFSVALGWLPTSGMYSLDRKDLLDHLAHLVMPVFVLSTGFIAGFSRYMRSQMLEVMREEYIHTARAKGLEESIVIFKHILRNALLPIVTLLGLSLPIFVSGALITEQVFGWPGLGQFFWQAATQRDYPVIMAILTLAAILTLLGNFLADLAYGLVDPRIRYD